MPPEDEGHSGCQVRVTTFDEPPGVTLGCAPKERSAGVSGRSHAAVVGHYGRTIGGRSLLEVSREGERITVRVAMNPA
jgi:hypothetical protein